MRPNHPTIPLSYATCSLGTTTTPLPTKLSILSSAGFTAIELAFPDLQNHASTLANHEVDIKDHDYHSLIPAALDIKHLAATHGLKILMLQPFSNFEGWPRGSREREKAFARAKGWIRLMEVLGTDMLQVGSSDTPLGKLAPSPSPSFSSLRENITEDLRELADLLEPKNMRLAYENWCWSSHAKTWREVWEIVRDVDRDNIGLCLDTFQSAAGEWGDPTTSTGIIDDVTPGSEGEMEITRRFEESMAKLSSTVPAEKIYLLQVSDGYRTADSAGGPLSTELGEDEAAPRGRWSHDFRPMPYDGGYLPIEVVGSAVLTTGFRGWFSMEIFDRGRDGEGSELDLQEFARRAREKMGVFVEKCFEKA
ncbi:sugar phosphate isomerase/epimerase family protein [Aspergillus lucknowensis]|uniref:Xylose isomerase-like protein n=1 Tax=Aspergillus lucknowensis TaxID=176173 RepID=A0ABR4M0H4_9EURO